MANESGKSKVIKRSDNPDFFAQGGKTGMFGPQHAGPQKSGGSSQDKAGDGGKFAAGGSGKMFGKGSAKPALAGQSGKESQ